MSNESKTSFDPTRHFSPITGACAEDQHDACPKHFDDGTPCACPHHEDRTQAHVIKQIGLERYVAEVVEYDGD